MNKNYQIIYFDGVCNLCNGFVDFVIKRDKKRLFRFASLQSDEGQKIFAMQGLEGTDLNTVYLLQNETLHQKSKAAIRIISQLPFPWKMFVLFIAVPALIGDIFYNVVAKNRIKWFGKKDSCRLPTKEEKELFI